MNSERRTLDFVSRKALAADDRMAKCAVAEPAASALPMDRNVAITMSRKALAADGGMAERAVNEPAASALPLTRRSPRELDQIDGTHVSRKALAAGSPWCVTDRIVEMIGELSQ